MVQKCMELDFYRICVVAQYWLPHFLENTLTESPGIKSGSLETYLWFLKKKSLAVTFPPKGKGKGFQG